MLGQLAWRGFSFAYGITNLVACVAIAAIRDGAFTKRTSEEGKRESAAAQERYWSIEREPLPGLQHEFITLRSGLKLHYVVNSTHEASSGRNVAIFIHGFPDSFLLWRNLLTAPTLLSHILIAVDLPGYGGSDGLQKYGPNEVLETMTEFILAMRMKYLKEQSRMVVVSHDWGGIIAARLASEANQLADRWIIASAIIPQHVRSNALTRFASARQMLHTYLRHPFNFRLLKNACSTLIPVLSQLGRSFYVFIFNLPYPLCSIFTTFGDYWFLRIIHNVAAGLLKPDGTFMRKLNWKEAADFLAVSTGPGIAQIEESEGVYPAVVRKRVRDYGLSEKIRLYREHLLLNPWEKSLETVIALSEIPTSPARSGSGAGLFDEGPPGALKAPATIVYGSEDRGFDKTLGLESIGDYLTKYSQVLFIEGAGHWLPFEGLGSKVLEDVVEWAMGDEQKPLRESFDGLKDVKLLAEK